MAKITANISIEAEIWEIAKSKYPQQISSLVEDYLKALVYSDVNDDKINIEQEQKRVIEGISTLKIELQNLELQKKQQIEQASTLQQQKQEQEQKKRFCFNCGNLIGTLKIYTTPKGNICKTCFFQSTKEQLKEWGYNA